MGLRISVDTAGTFTDVVDMDETGAQTIGKALTTGNSNWLWLMSGSGVLARII